jgi:hypothetical protein
MSESAEWAGRPAGKRIRDQRPRVQLRPPGILQTGTHRPRRIPWRPPSAGFADYGKGRDVNEQRTPGKGGWAP